jgi:N-acetylmuramoyl-L-alanine amidase
MRFFYCFLIFYCFAFPLAAKTAITRVAIQDGGDVLRIETQEKPDYRLFSLGNPNRLVVDIKDGHWQAGKTPTNIRRAQNSANIYRIVFDAPRAIKSFRYSYNADKKIIEISLTYTGAKSLAKQAKAAINKKDPVLKKDTTPPPKNKPTSKKYVIVLDPGHGGKDPGATGVTGMREKDLVLKMAQEIQTALSKNPKYTVKLTRSDDRFIRLDERVKIAQEHGANLFISIHADAHTKPTAIGASVYTLSERSSDPDAALLAAKENKADMIGGIDLSGESNEVMSILVDLVQRDTMNLSARFAGLLVAELKNRIDLKKNTHRFAGFVVLKAPDVPSVLLELGFLSNPKEEWLLKQKSYRNKIAQGIVEAVDQYFKTQKTP